MDYEDHSKVLKCLTNDQDAEQDLREEIDEIVHFMHHPQGQWEPQVWTNTAGRPRYTFDQTKPLVGKIWAEMGANDYAATTQPVGGGANDDVSKILDGLLRNSYNISGFSTIAKKSGKRMIATGLGGWRLVSKYVDSRSMYQDLVWIPINNFHRRVWFDANAELQTKEDANHVNILSNVSREKAKQIAGREVESVSDQKSFSTYSHKPENNIIIGEILYKKRTAKTIYIVDGEDGVFDAAGLKKLNITPDDNRIIDFREVEDIRVFSRKYDNSDWIGDEKETVFSYLPIIPEYANFDISEDGKTTYEGAIRSIMDACRVYNYAESRKVEDSVLQPSDKMMIDDRVSEGYIDNHSNINRDPRYFQQFNGKAADEAKLPFFPLPGPKPNPAVSEISGDMIKNIQLSTGLPNDVETLLNTRRDSDFRADQRNSVGQVGTFEYYIAHQIALEYSAKVFLDAVPRVYDTARKIRTIDEAGQSSEVDINTPDQNGQTINDVINGQYDVTVTLGESFQSRREQANSSILELGKINPAVVERNTDIIANNISAPGMSTVAERERDFLFKQGAIPRDQWTDKEIEAAEEAKASQGQQPDPATIIAQAEVAKAQAEQRKVEQQALIEQAKLEQRQIELQMKEMELRMQVQTQNIKNAHTVAETGKTIAETDKITTEQLAQQQAIFQQSTEVNTP